MSNNIDWATVSGIIDRGKMAEIGAGLPFSSHNMSVELDTPLAWVNALGNKLGIYYTSYAQKNCFAGQPETYGVLRTTILDTNPEHATVYQKWHSWMGTAEKVRFANLPNTILPEWKAPNT